MFIITCFAQGFTALTDVYSTVAQSLGANNYGLVVGGEIWRLITHMFLHGSLMHIVVNMYSLFILGSQMETFVGKVKFIIVYFDDILIYSKNNDDRIDHVRLVSIALCKASLFANLKKCDFCTNKLLFLSFIVSTKGIKVDEEKVKVIKK